jgi:hypothetical protein
MIVNGCDCSIVIKTSHIEKDIPFADETMREAVSLLEEEAAIEGGGVCKAIRKNSGVTGCIVSPLTISTAPILLSLAMGAVGKPVYVSETRNLYRYRLELLPMEDTEHFDLIQDRSGERRLFEACRVNGFELRIMREAALKLKLDIWGDRSPAVYPYTDTFERASGERFNGDEVTYRINDKEYKNIYGVTLVSKKENGTKTELWIKRALEQGSDIPANIEEMTITAKLLRDSYEYKRFGTFSITLKKLILKSDETEINSVDAVIGPLRFYVTGTVFLEVYTSDEVAVA